MLKVIEAHKAKLNEEKIKKELLKKRNFFEYQELGYKINDFINIKYYDVLNETGSKKKFLGFTLGKLVKTLVPRMGITLVIAFLGLFPYARAMKLDANKQQYKEEIEEYNDRIDKIAEYVSSQDFTETEKIMFLYDNMYGMIQGYKTPEIDAFGYYRLDIYPGGYGVCRNMADDLTAKLNLINPKYHAIDVMVQEEFGDNYQLSNVEVRNLNNTSTLETTDTTNENKKEELIDKLIPNHMVTFCKIPGRNFILVLDPTNVSIGVLENGTIKMFNGENAEVDIKYIIEYFEMDTKTSLILNQYVIESYYSTEHYEDLIDEFGLEAQNASLEKIK